MEKEERLDSKVEQNGSSDHQQRDRTVTEGTTFSKQTLEDAALPPVPPDGGYGWVIMIGVILL